MDKINLGEEFVVDCPHCNQRIIILLPFSSPKLVGASLASGRTAEGSAANKMPNTSNK